MEKLNRFLQAHFSSAANEHWLLFVNEHYEPSGKKAIWEYELFEGEY